MRFVVDECTGPAVARWLEQHYHDVFSVYDEARGSSDDAILDKAVREGRILVTNDKDFGEMIYRQGRRHNGVILLRLADERASQKKRAISRLLDQYPNRLSDEFVVVSETRVRFGRLAR